MMMQTIWRKGSFASCHRISNHKGKCHNLHGHNYNFEIGISYDLGMASLNECNYVIDFGDIKKKYLEAIDKFFDHSVIANEKDYKVIELAKQINDPTRVLTTIGDPSVEVISQMILYLCYQVSKKNNLKIKYKYGNNESEYLDYLLVVNKIKIYETDNSCCELAVSSQQELEDIKVTEQFKSLIEYNL